MLGSIRLRTGLLLALTAAGAVAGAGPVGGRGQDPPPRHEQARGGVTVRVEKIAVERVFNAEGWLRARYGPGWRREVPPDVRQGPLRVVRVFVSVIVDEAAAGPLEEVGGMLSLGGGSARERPADTGPRWGPLVTAHFDPPLWRRELPDLELDPAARGLIVLKVVGGDEDIAGLFPAEVRVRVGTTGAEEQAFRFTVSAP